MKQFATWLVVMIFAVSIVGCGKNRSPVSPSTVTQSGSGFSGSADTTATGNAGSPARIDGVISDFSGSASAFQFRLGDRLVRGDGASRVIDGSRTRDGSALRNGLRIGVDGIDRGDHVYASTITLSGNGSNDSAPPSSPNPNPSPGPTRSPAPSPTPESNDTTTVSGVLGSVSGVCPALAFPINGSVVVTNSSTVYTGGSCRSLVLGARADVQGTPTGGVVVAREIRVR